MNRLSELPDEVILTIISMLSAKDILAFAATNRAMKGMIEHSSELSFILQLYLQGRRQSPNYSRIAPSYSTLLKDLRMGTRLWRQFHPARVLEIRNVGDFYQLVDGLLVLAMMRDGNLQELRFYDLWSQQDPRMFEPWLIRVIPSCRIFDFLCDPTQDLLILVCHNGNEVNVRVLTISQGVSHPLAKRSEFTTPLNDAWTQCLIKIHGSLTTLRFSEENIWSDEIQVQLWNWKIGQLLYTSPGPGVSAIIGDDCLVLLNLPDESGTVGLELVSIKSPTTTSVRLALPFDEDPLEATMISETPPVNAPYLPGLTTGPFSRDECSERIVVLYLFFATDFVTVVISVQHLLRRFREDMDCEWPVWGPDATRWIRNLGTYGSHSCVSGAVYCTQTACELQADEEGYYNGKPELASADNTAARTIAIFDFNSRPIRKGDDWDGEGVHEESDRMVGKPVTQEWTWTSDVVSKPVKSRLPFRLFARRWPACYEEIMVSSDHLVGRHMDQVSYDILQFSNFNVSAGDREMAN
ncbi:hypothetical protein CPB86DRAFT_768297 [Serendipita vermifera]|nr:hypothetical protein CPB86DRAFT_768297 [Serendipita vermifera]